MAFGAPNKNPKNSPRVISIEVGKKFYEELQRQMSEAVSSLTSDQILATLLILFGLSLLGEILPKNTPESEQDERSFIWSYLSQLQKELPEGKTLSDLLREANIQLVMDGKPVALREPSNSIDNAPDDPFEGFKRGWDDAMKGRTMSFEDFERRMLEDAD
ncbi:MAG: hypothetical protein GC204_01220 [Chloroflexi bacterium]|nr:hypothetical protein [Chloroflexota bacterium]